MCICEPRKCKYCAVTALKSPVLYCIVYIIFHYHATHPHANAYMSNIVELYTVRFAMHNAHAFALYVVYKYSVCCTNAGTNLNAPCEYSGAFIIHFCPFNGISIYTYRDKTCLYVWIPMMRIHFIRTYSRRWYSPIIYYWTFGMLTLHMA